VGLGGDEVEELKSRLSELEQGVQRIRLDAAERTALVLPIRGLADSATLVVLAGPFTPGFGADEMNRVQQFMSAFVTALDRRQLIVQLEDSNAQLVEANKHKSVFLASMSHELRTPLNAILGFSELLMDSGKETFTPETRHRFLEQIHSSGKHLLGLINDILDLSKIEAGQMDLRLQVVNIAEIVEQVRNTVEPLAIQKNITLKGENVDAGTIVADAGKVKQMLLNLVSNAIKFTPDNGMITIQARRLDDAVELSVIDTGIGIAKEDFGRVFREFQQLDSGVGRQQPGTGLGLTLTRRFANLHGGDVRMDSELGRGSVFTITLPLEARRAVAAPQTVAAERPAVAISRPLVLVVEDDPAAAELLIRQIERAGFRTQVARTGGQALAAARAQKPAAITLDILLPDLDGWEVLTRLKNDAATSMIPVIVVSVVDNPELGIALGALDYFVKPVPAEELMSRLAKFKAGHTEGRKAEVLVVDDEFGIVDVLETILTDEGYRVVTACNGKQGLVRLSAEKPDVILLDFMMPILGGAEMLRAMAAEPAYQRIPVIMISSLGEDVIAEKCKGYAAFLHKPFRAAAVLSTVARVLGSGANVAA